MFRTNLVEFITKSVHRQFGVNGPRLYLIFIYLFCSRQSIRRSTIWTLLFSWNNIDQIWCHCHV